MCAHPKMIKTKKQMCDVNLEMGFLVDAADVIICCTISLGLGLPSLFRI